MQQKNDANKWLRFLPYVILIAAVISLFSMNPGSSSQELDYNTLQDVLVNQDVTQASLSVGSNVTTIKGVYENNGQKVTFSSKVPSTSDEIAKVMTDLSGARVSVVDADASNAFLDTLLSFLPVVLMFGVTIWMVNRMAGAGSANKQAFDFSKSRARLEGKVKVRFSDVAGCDEEKAEMAEIIDYLKYPKKFERMGARIPKGILLSGHPGTGKTLLAKAVAGEANVPFYSISGSDFVEMFVGVGASRVRDMFKKAKETAPCIIFIDEIDAVGRQRGAGFGGGHDEREQTLNQLLVEMDGMEDNTGVVVIAATNRPDVLDPALLRAGRFDRQITVSLPDRKGRTAILKVHARNKHFANDIDLDALAKRTPGFSGADLENVLNESAILAVRENLNEIGMKQIDEAIDRVMMGPAKVSRTYDEKTKKLVAYHESGHAIVGLYLDDAQVVQKVTIIPRGQAGGYNLMTPKEEKMMNTKNDLLATITSYMGGRVAEELFFDDVTTGASNDIERATNIAKDMVTLYGMSDLGPIKYNSGSENVFLGRDYNSPNNVSGQVAFEIDEEVRKIVNECHDKAKEVISDHKEELIRIANALMEYETLTAEQIQKVVKGEPIEDTPADKPADQPAETAA
ncbi:ATP-dependent zinc metalloprotease FtsH [Stecheria sp. CLA-KB-P133]|uniref:ATP-dependent zinc metalloprotease FtsH n=1 Tax=Grylomicrobium aquisgranensis TaxID=2926318 RepID=A0AB35U6C3_9FIRM|nr:ATP-dependent zinc metalloprotease FtsH [Lactimicrobium massiliense]MDX8420579.1 ATP-dependent zinc metalloprotease FtsH [Stecheria sp. CLA-KB-P133]MDY3931384.1 ATP-dependent zinc metalloprotease FtsH [Erysipelotrichaceae bacterium]MDD6458365.1 ATP-dependent zinc metalloprotease FtsH [Lactimicrobium massiliense]MDD6674207.1 ATP-dependent zinc metalloprotease FtsH [Lactimicrobium massiliense]MDD6727047.1 ATP-dependent zinc metalloprotease FtsH [Lactimicrobium massiliense]